MLQIACPHCGIRDEAEFSYRGDATRARPAPDAGIDAFVDYVYTRSNPRGWQVEWWLHTAGCRAVLKVVRHTLTHEIRAVVAAHERVDLPSA
jgi:heterotetrameric sarcosine oxidase delta subunit